MAGERPKAPKISIHRHSYEVVAGVMVVVGQFMENGVNFLSGFPGHPYPGQQWSSFLGFLGTVLG